MAPCEFVLVSANPLRRLCVSKRSRCGAVQYSCSRNGLWKLSRGFARLLLQSRGRGFDSPLVHGSSGLKIAALKYKRSTRSVLLQLRLENAPAAQAGKSQLLSANVVRGACSCISGWKIAAFKYKRSTRSVLLQLRLENHNF